MRHWKWCVGQKLIVILMVLILVGCSAPEATPTAEVAAPVEQPTQPQITATSVEATATVESSPTPASTATEVAVVDYCLECHTDKDQLILTAKIEEEAPKESEGAG
jgi:PBP1b-binding outer membrane lipoprotein LpoB